MNPDQKTRLLIGTLAAAVILVVGYGIYQAQEPAPQSAPQPVAVQSEAPPAPAAAVPGAPLLRITASSPVPAGSTGNKASASADADLASFEWTIQGGTLEGDVRSASVLWTAGTGAEVTLTCTGTGTTGQTGTASLRIPLRQAPAITRFEAEPKVVTQGSATRLSWTAANAGRLVLTPGDQDLTRFTGPLLELKPNQTTTYTLTATNSSGITATRELAVKVVAPPAISAFRAEPVPGSLNFSVIGEFSGGKAELKQGGQVLASSQESPLRAQLQDPKAGVALVLTVTNEAGTFVSSTLNFAAKTP